MSDAEDDASARGTRIQPLDAWVESIRKAASVVPQEEDEMQIWSMDLVYGELLASSIVSMLHFALAHCRTLTAPSARQFVDLGSGEGVPCIVAALMGFARSEGIELVPRLNRRGRLHVQYATELLPVLPPLAGVPDLPPSTATPPSASSSPQGKAAASTSEGASPPTSPADSATAPAAASTAPAPVDCVSDLSCVSLEVGDFLESDWSPADVVFCNGTCYDIDILEPLYKKAEKLRPGAIFALTTHKVTSVLFELLHECVVGASWGSATLRIYRRKALPKWIGTVVGARK
jgi:hypothetical protein